MTLKKLLTLLARIVIALALVQSLVTWPATTAVDPEHGHLEVSLAGSAGTALSPAELDSFIVISRNPSFLASTAVDNPSLLAPCSLLTAALASGLMNTIFTGVTHPGVIQLFPSQGTNILGRYDDDIALGKGAIPRDDPNKAADILARLVVFHSWGLSTRLNTLITPLNQGACLQLLADPVRLDKALSRLAPSKAVMIHTAPVNAYIAAYGRSEGNVFLAELLQPGFLDKPSSFQTNPLSPCSLLRAFRLAARLNDTWHNKLVKGNFDVSDKPGLAIYETDIGDIPAHGTATSREAEAMAAVFATEIMRANDLTSLLMKNTTQRECLNEIFEPGLLRIKLLKEGVIIPMR